MDPFDTSLFEPPADTGEDEKKPVDPFDIFGEDDNDMFSSQSKFATPSGKPGVSTGAAKGSGDLFNFGDEDDGIAGFMAAGTALSTSRSAPVQDLDDLFGPPPPPTSSVAVDKSNARGAEFVSSSSSAAAGGTSLFDDLLDFTSSSATLPGATQSPSSLLDLDAATDPQNDPPASKPTASSSDWLFGGDDAVDAWQNISGSGTTTQQEQTTGSENSSITEDTLETKVETRVVSKPEKTDGESSKSLDVLVTAPSMDVDSDLDKDIASGISPGLIEKTDGEKENEGDGEKGLLRGMKTSVSSDVSDKVDSRHSSTSDFDMDFSILELPTSAHLNFDMSNHKRTLSKKGSFSLRKKPTRAAIHTSKLATNEDSIFVDSTEPRPPKSPLANEEDDSEEQPARKKEAEVPREESPSRPAKKVAGGMKIPGLLEGLMGSKRFNKNENKQVTGAGSSDKSISSNTTKTSLFSKPSSETASTSNLSKPSPPNPAPRQKPMALPRVLPTLPSKPLRSVNKESGKSSEEPDSSPASFLSKKSVLKSPETPEKTGPSKLSPALKKDGDAATASPLSSGKETRPSVSSTPAKSPPSLAPSRVLPSIGDGDSKKPSPGLGQDKPDVRKKPPTVMKKPALRSRPDKPAAPEEKDTKDTKPGSVFNKPFLDSKLKENTLSSGKLAAKSKPVAEIKSTPETKPSEECSFDGKEKSSDSKRDTKPTEEKAPEETFVVVDKSDCKDEQKSDLSESETTVSTPVISPLKETDENKPVSEKSSSELSKEDEISVPSKSTSTSPKKSSTGLSQSSPFSSSNKPSFLSKPNITKPKPDTPTKPTTSTPPQRKSSVSGMSSVKPPSSSDKSSSKTSGSPAGNMGRRDSITGSAYNPIGFRSALCSSDSGSESRSRGSSVNSDIKTRRDSVSSVGSDITKKVSDLNSSGGLTKESSSPREDEGDDKVEVIMRKKPENSESKPSWLTEANKNSLNRTKRPEVADKTKEAADEANKIIKDQGILRKTSLTSKPSTTSSTKNEAVTEGNKSSSPWGVRLRKVDSSRPKSVVEPPTNNENSSPGQNWRQQMSQKRQSFVPPKEVEEPKQQDSTPEWAKASLQRRQRLLDAGVINSDAK